MSIAVVLYIDYDVCLVQYFMLNSRVPVRCGDGYHVTIFYDNLMLCGHIFINNQPSSILEPTDSVRPSCCNGGDSVGAAATEPVNRLLQAA